MNPYPDSLSPSISVTVQPLLDRINPPEAESAVSAEGGRGARQISPIIIDRAFQFEEVSMPYWVYILQNKTSGKLYKGQTSDLEKRIERHHTYESGSMRYTYKHKGPWRLIYSEVYSNRAEAMKRERLLKSVQG